MTRQWSATVTKHSDALDLEEGVFTWSDPHKIAESLKHSAEASQRRKAEPYQSAMSMLNFYINRSGKNLSKEQRKTLERAKDELKHLFKRS
jgi:hypothetical protein